MEQLSFFEKLAVLGSNILAHPIFILLLLSPIIVFALNKKITKKIVITTYVAILLVVLFVGNTVLFELLDNVIDGIFMLMYFPSFVTLFIVEVASAGITLVTFLKKEMLTVNKVINIGAFIIIQTMFCLILTVVQINDVDIYKETALYDNNDVLTLMQLLMGTFTLQILAVLIFNSIEKITEFLDNNDEKVKQYRNLERAKGLILDEPEALFIPKKEQIIEQPMEPLNKALISEEKVTPISLIDAINEEKANNVIKIPKVKVEEILEIKPEEKIEETVTPEIFKVPPIITLSEPKREVEPEPLDVKPMIIEQPKENKFVNPIVEEIFEASKEEVEEIPEEELITGLVIVNLTKTLMGIKNIKRIYTM